MGGEKVDHTIPLRVFAQKWIWWTRLQLGLGSPIFNYKLLCIIPPALPSVQRLVFLSGQPSWYWPGSVLEWIGRSFIETHPLVCNQDIGRELVRCSLTQTRLYWAWEWWWIWTILGFFFLNLYLKKEKKSIKIINIKCCLLFAPPNHHHHWPDTQLPFTIYFLCLW